MNQKCCTTCDRVDVNEMTDERYCSLKDYAQIKLKWHKHRPDWCPLVMQKGQKNDQYTGNKLAEGLRAKSG